MTEVKMPKYRVVFAKNAEEFEDRVNALAEGGYVFKTMNVSDHSDTSLLYGVMALGENDYSNVTQIKDIAPELADDAIRVGWEPVSMSLSTKFIRFVRRKKI